MSPIAPGETMILLDDSLEGGQGGLLFRSPREEIVAREMDEIGLALSALAEARKCGLYAAGFLSYELGYALEERLRPLMPSRRSVPLLWFATFDAPERLMPHEIEAWLDAVSVPGHGLWIGEPSLTEAEYLQTFAHVEDAILAGDLYQMNLTFKTPFALSGNPLSLYREMRRLQPVAHGGMVLSPHFTILSSSPEQFIGISDGWIESRPMKGTAARGTGEAGDREQKAQLARDEKNRAENLMIVDLMRNDLGRICEIGSVEVPALFEIESYSTVHQMISMVRGRLRQDVDLTTLIQALFPPGSVTGAPKIRAMELIRTLETEPRGVYTGAIGMLAPDGGVSFNVAIRTAVVLGDGRGEFGIGSGVVADSIGADEYAECLLKMRFFHACASEFQLIESLRFDRRDGFWLLDEHLERIERSARDLGFACDMGAVRSRLDQAVEGSEADVLRVRLLLCRDGSIDVTAVAMDRPDAGAMMSYVISEHRVSSGDGLLAHKTTRRQFYDSEQARLSAALGVEEVLFLNERGELAEGSRTNIFVERDGKLLTPALSSGLLPGTLRARLLAEGRAEEAILTVADLDGAERVWLGNSVRGLLVGRMFARNGRG